MRHCSFINFLVLSIVFLCRSPVEAATCYGNDPCRACSSCGYCGNCNSGGNPCGVLKALKGISSPSSSVRGSSVLVTPIKVQRRHYEARSAETAKYRISSFRSKQPITAVKSIRTTPAAELNQSLPEPSPVPVNAPISRTAQPSLSKPVLTESMGSCVWQLTVDRSSAYGDSESLVGFYHWGGMDEPGKIEAWNNWAKRILHLIYAGITSQQGTRSQFENYTIYVRADGKVMLKGDSSLSGDNMAKLKSVVAQLEGRPELVFPTSLTADTVFLTGQLGYGPLRVAKDVWGRPEESTNSRYPRSW